MNGSVRFEVHDTGIGMIPEHLGNPFEAFSPAGASTALASLDGLWRMSARGHAAVIVITGEDRRRPNGEVCRILQKASFSSKSLLAGLRTLAAPQWDTQTLQGESRAGFLVVDVTSIAAATDLYSMAHLRHSNP